jgi:hypothetical protein
VREVIPAAAASSATCGSSGGRGWVGGRSRGIVASGAPATGAEASAAEEQDRAERRQDTDDEAQKDPTERIAATLAHFT